jgi:membrane-associated phospholipid phosphatase
MSRKSRAFFWILTIAAVRQATAQQPGIEPGAGNWKTWVISSGRDYRVAPPPGPSVTAEEAAWVRELMAKNDSQTLEQVRFWDAGPTPYRWIDMISKRLQRGEPTTAFPHRVLTYVSIAMYDATVAAWESKYFYNRPRPSEADPSIRPLVAVPRSPSYPSEHAAAAGAASAVLAALLPSEAAYFQSLAEEAARSRLFAGVQYPSDYFAGLELGRRVAERVLERARTDGSDATWTGTVPVGPCNWTGANPGNVTMPNWRPFRLTSPNEFRPTPPPDCQSDVVKADTEAVRQYTRTFNSNSKAFFWQTVDGITVTFYDLVSKYLFEDSMNANAPRAARAYALLATAFFDAFIASNDGKYAYWYLRPHQLDNRITPLFPVPNFPSYPSNHSTLSTARGEILAYLFPSRADFVRAYGKEAGDSRIWAGIHYEIDNQAGVQLGKSVAQKFIEWAESDGSQSTGVN